MKDNQNNNQQNQHNRSSSNPEKSFETGKQGGQKSQQTTNQGTNNLNAMGNSMSQGGNQNKPSKNSGQGSSLTDTSRGDTNDTSNSLKRDAVGNRGANDYTPLNQTDNELGTEKRRNSPGGSQQSNDQ